MVHANSMRMSIYIADYISKFCERDRALTCTFVPCTPTKAAGPFGLKRNTKKLHGNWMPKKEINYDQFGIEDANWDSSIYTRSPLFT